MRLCCPPAGYNLTPHVTVREIQEAVCEHFDIPMIEMISDRRARPVARPRQIAMYFSREFTPFSLPNIGRFFGGRDHTTIMHGITQVERLIREDKEVRHQVKTIRERLVSVKGNSVVDKSPTELVSEPMLAA